MSHGEASHDGPITVFVSRIIKTDRIADFEEWVKRINHDTMMECEGYLGYNLIRPSDHRHPEYVMVLKFATYDDVKEWEESEVRGQWLAKSYDFTVGDYHMRKESGLEYWFRTSADKLPPPKIKMAVVTFVAIYPTVYVVRTVLQPVSEVMNPLLTLLVVQVVIVGLMTYVMMPLMTRLFRFWLYRSR